MRYAPAIALRIQNHPQKLQAATMLAEGVKLTMTWDEIASSCDVSRQTLYEWRQEKEFAEAVATMTQERLKDTIPGVFDMLIGVVRDKEEDTKDKLRAGELLLKAGGMLIDRVDATYREDARGILDSLDRELQEIKEQGAKEESSVLPDVPAT